MIAQLSGTSRGAALVGVGSGCNRFFHHSVCSKSSISSTDTSRTKTITTTTTPTKDLEFPQFDTIGNPSTLMLIQSPPSIPVHFRKDSLVSLYFPDQSFGTSSPLSDLITSELNYSSIINSIFSLSRPISYQKMISTVPFNAVINGNGHDSTFKTFYNLELDGTSDWAILPHGAIQAYTGSNLIIKNKFQPAKVSRKLWKILQKNKNNTGSTGLSKYQLYNFISGRGSVGLVGNGEIIELDLQYGESVVINKDHLLGLQIDGINDLNNLVYQEPLLNNMGTTVPQLTAGARVSSWGKLKGLFSALKPVPADSKSVVEVNITKNRQVDQFLTSIKKLSLISWNIISKSFSGMAKFGANLMTSDVKYITVMGPTKILLQSSAKSVRLASSSSKFSASGLAGTFSRSLHNTSPDTTGGKAEDAELLPVKKEDMLSYVSISNGKAVFESTESFQETVNSIEAKNPNLKK
ncbi:hypothetical protein DASC09_060030 [Saccharomycopsis crataegensis]|uniref:Altered inheritance of mitochondria protein 24, mitochondrial n=1 Tax=Saccharomycopsis crataegensis TaxID=43959 RepID=A0AAV5QVC1_9ASCO|nr:hypothetical protein DASC09_060030 [Saccharomycopsis crataegensis]